jgi:phosphohistidine phosphatase SixA
MSIFLVRHAKAGSRSNWEGDDLLRPLSPNGWKQAQALAKRLRREGVTTLSSSPYLRCRQTLEPLGALLDLDVRDDERLREGEPFDGAIDLLGSVADGAVLCSHGDVIPETIAALQRRGCAISTPADWRKATVWTIERGADGEFLSAVVTPPPA